MDHRTPLRDEDIEEALSSSAHRRILATCIRRPVSVKQISETTSLPLASAYRNVRALEDRGLLIVERSALTVDGKPYDLYRSRIREASLRVSGDGVQVDWQVEASVEDRLLRMWNYLGSRA